MGSLMPSQEQDHQALLKAKYCP